MCNRARAFPLFQRAIRIRGRGSSALVIKHKGNVGRNDEVTGAAASRSRAQVRRKCIKRERGSHRTSHPQPAHGARAKGEIPYTTEWVASTVASGAAGPAHIHAHVSGGPV